jgi:hypothetical protein
MEYSFGFEGKRRDREIPKKRQETWAWIDGLWFEVVSINIPNMNQKCYPLHCGVVGKIV